MEGGVGVSAVWPGVRMHVLVHVRVRELLVCVCVLLLLLLPLLFALAVLIVNVLPPNTSSSHRK